MTAVKRGAIGSDFPKFKVALVYAPRGLEL